MSVNFIQLTGISGKNAYTFISVSGPVNFFLDIVQNHWDDICVWLLELNKTYDENGDDDDNVDMKTKHILYPVHPKVFCLWMIFSITEIDYDMSSWHPYYHWNFFGLHTTIELDSNERKWMDLSNLNG